MPSHTDLYLIIRKGPHPGQAHPLRGDTIILGRESTNQIVIDDRLVSRRHVRLVRQGNSFILEDLDSVNGTWVNEIRVTGPVLLHPGDIIRLGQDVELTYGHLVSAPPAAPPSNNRNWLLLSLGGTVGIMAVVILLLAAVIGYLWLARPDQEGAPTLAASLPETPALLPSPQTVVTAPPEPTTAPMEPTAVATSEPITFPTFTPTPTVPPVNPDPPHELLTFVDNFSNPDRAWPVVREENREQYYEDGELIYWIKMPGRAVWSSGSLGIFTDFTFEADARLVEGPEQARYGLIFRQQDNNDFYYFVINGAGQYQVGQKKGGEWQPLSALDWQPSSYLGPGQATNRLKVVAAGPHMSFYVNGHYLTTIEDTNFQAGQIGLIAQASQETGPFKVAFDNVRAYIPQPEPPVAPDPPHTELLYRNDFSQPEGLGEKVTEKHEKFFDNGRYVVLLKKDRSTAWVWDSRTKFSDFTLEMNAQVVDDTGGPNAWTEQGLMFRIQDSKNFYLFAVKDTGDYLVSKRLNGETTLFEGGLQASPHINPGQASNRLKVIAAGPDISLYINEQYLLTVTDDSFKSGYIGLSASRQAEGGMARLAFDNLQVYGSAQEQAAAAPPPTPTPQPHPTATQRLIKSGLNKIVFTSSRHGNQEIYVMNADGSGVTRLTNNPAEDHSPVWSPDGGTIAFVSNRDGNAEIYLMAADGRGQTNLTENPANDYDPTWSGNGASLAFTSSRDDPIRTDIWIMNSDGSKQTKMQNFAVSPAWSPDNSRIAAIFRFGGLTHLGVMPANGRAAPRPLLKMGSSNFPAWSPDSQRLAFENAESPDNSEILVIKADGSNLVNLTNNRDIIDLYPTWSPDGSRIAFVSDRDGNNEIYVMNADGSGLKRLTNNAAWDGQPNWSR